MALAIGQACNTPDGSGVVCARERFGNDNDDYRLGVKHHVYPPKRIPGFYRDDVLYFYPKEVSASQADTLTR